jgi:hypothetical protein
MKKVFAIALVAAIAQVAVIRAQTPAQSEVVKADEAITKLCRAATGPPRKSCSTRISAGSIQTACTTPPKARHSRTA